MHSHLLRACVHLFFTLIIGIGGQSFAQNKDAISIERIRHQLRTIDAKARQGTLVYDIRNTVSPAPAVAIEMEKRSKIESQRAKEGRVEPKAAQKRLAQMLHEAEVLRQGSQDRWVQTFVYSENGQFKSSIRPLTSDVAPLDEVYDGVNSKRVQDDVLDLVRDELDPQSKRAFLEGFSTNGCVLIGRGLSRLTLLNAKRAGRNVVIEGKTSDGLNVTALLDPAHDLMITRLTCSTQEDELLYRWALSQPRRISDGVWIPSTAILELAPGQTLSAQRVFHLVSASFRAPSEAISTPSLLRQWSLIRDSRLGLTVSYKKVPEGVNSEADLLAVTRQKVAALNQAADILARNKGKGRATRKLRISLSVLFALSGATFCYVLAVKKRGNRRIMVGKA